jgi:uncharacterized protein
VGFFFGGPTVGMTKIKPILRLILSTYAILITQLLVITYIMWKARSSTLATKLCSLWGALLSLIISITLIYLLFVLRPFVGTMGQLVILCLLTLVIGFTLPCLTNRFPWQDVKRTLLSAILIFIFMSILGAITITLGWQLGFMKGILFGLLIAFIVVGITFWFIPVNRQIHKIYHFIGVTIFSLYVLYDTNQLVKRPSLTPPEAALEFFLDFVNIFIHLLSGQD